jgi:hypothetical protein
MLLREYICFEQEPGAKNTASRKTRETKTRGTRPAIQTPSRQAEMFTGLDRQANQKASAQGVTAAPAPQENVLRGEAAYGREET